VPRTREAATGEVEQEHHGRCAEEDAAVAIWTGENHRSPIFMNRKLAPQMTASDPNFTCHGTRCLRTGVSSAPEPAPLSTLVTSRVTRTR
jgi:hypothetical protein